MLESTSGSCLRPVNCLTTCHSFFALVFLILLSWCLLRRVMSWPIWRSSTPASFTRPVCISLFFRLNFACREWSLVYMPQGEKTVSGVVFPHWPIGFNGIFLTQMYSTHAWKVDCISVCAIYHWNLSFIGCPKIQSRLRSMLEFVRNWQKCNSWHTQNWLSAAHHNAAVYFYLWYVTVFTARCTVMQSTVLRSHVVCPSVTLVDQDHIDWKSWKLIAWTISPTSLLFVAQRSSTYSQGNMEKFWGDYSCGTSGML